MKKGIDGLLYLPKDHAYYTQVQGEMAVLGVEWCDFTVFSNETVVVDRIVADYDYWMDQVRAILHSACGTRIVISKDTN